MERNGLVLSNELRDDLVSVSTKSDRVMLSSYDYKISWLTSYVLMLLKWVVYRMKNKRFGNIWIKS